MHGDDAPLDELKRELDELEQRVEGHAEDILELQQRITSLNETIEKRNERF